MINVDGVIYGNFRCDITGMDLNRRWQDPSRIFHPQIFEIKNKIQSYHKKYRI
jgi:murein tripeptide amidase MpaA